MHVHKDRGTEKVSRKSKIKWECSELDLAKGMEMMQNGEKGKICKYVGTLRGGILYHVYVL